MLRETADLVFTTSLGGTRLIRVPEPMPVITSALLDMVEGRILAANPFDETVGSLVALKRADRVVVHRTTLLP